MFKISRQIWNTFQETAEIRATYLRSLCQSFKCSTYLDIGAGSCKNTSRFGEYAEDIVALERKREAFQKISQDNKMSLLIADAMYLPFQDKTFEVISAFAMIEYVQDKQAVLKEIFRVSIPKGRLLIQIPNAHFPIDLHSGFPFLYYIPRRARTFILKALGYERLADEVNTPTLPKLLKILREVRPNVQAKIEKVVYPSEILIPFAQPIGKILNKIRLFRIIPFGYFLIIAT